MVGISDDLGGGLESDLQREGSRLAAPAARGAWRPGVSLVWASAAARVHGFDYRSSQTA